MPCANHCGSPTNVDELGVRCMDGTPMEELVPMMRNVLQHAADLRTSEGLSTRLLWKSTTASIKGGGIEQDWAKVVMKLWLARQICPTCHMHVAFFINKFVDSP